MKGAARRARFAGPSFPPVRAVRHRPVSLAHERQASGAAQGFLRGDRGLYRRLTAAPASEFRSPASAATPLPSDLRVELESAFGADLGAVRLHLDQASALAVRATGARAFTSGASIYFGAGEFSPWSPAGRALLAHEVAHVLQQRGQAAAENRIGVTAGHGHGAVQCGPPTDEPVPEPSQEEIESQRQSFGQLAIAHRGGRAPSDDPALNEAIDKVSSLLDRRLVVGQKDPPAFAVPLNDATKNGDFARLFSSVRAKSFVYECLRLLGFHEQAARILETDPKFEIRVATVEGRRFGDFISKSPKFGRKWLSQFLKHREFAAVWPATTVKGWRSFFLNPSRVPPMDAALLRKLHENDAEIDELNNTGSPRLRAEHYYLTWLLIGELDDERARESQALRNRLISLARRQPVIQILVLELPSLRREEEAKVDREDVSPAERAIAAAKVKIIDEVLPFWQQAIAEYLTWVAAFRSLSTAKLATAKAVPGLPDGSRIAPLLTPFRKPLVDAALALFAPIRESAPGALGEGGGLRLPSVEEYRLRLDAFIAALISDPLALKKGGDKQSWADHLDQLVATEAGRRPKADKGQVLLVSLLPFIVNDLVFSARNYDAAKDAASPAFEDVRAAHRFEMARFLAFVARWLRWDDLLATVSDVLIGAEDREVPEEERQPELWLISDWEPEESLPISRMVEDFPGQLDKPVLHDTPLSLRHLAEWFRYSYSHRLRETLEDLLRVEDFLTPATEVDIGRINRLRQGKKDVEKAMAPSAQAELAIADAAAAKFPLTVPQRFVVRDWDVRIPPGSTPEWNELITQHPKTEKQVIRRAYGWIFPSDIAQGVFGWALPALDGLVLLMKHIPTIAALARNSGLEGADWLAQLAPDTSASPTYRPEDARKVRLSAEDWARLNDVLLLWLQRMRQEEERPLPGLWRRTAVLFRRSAVMRLRPRIDYYARYTTVTGGPMAEKPAEIGPRRRIPEDVVDAVYRFEPTVRSMLRDAEDPDAAAEVQTALFVFAIAPSTLKVDLGLADGYFKRHLFAFYTLAVDYATDEEKLKRLRAGTEIQDEVNSIVQSKDRLEKIVAAMKEAMTTIETELAESQDETGFSSPDGKSIVPNASRVRHEIEVAAKPGSKHEWFLHQTVGPGRQVEPGSGLRYALTKVHRKFWFHPHAGSAPVKSLRAGAGGPYKPAKLVYIDDSGEKREVLSPETHPELAEVELFNIQIGDGDLTRVHANDVYLLEQLSDIFLWRSFQLEMQSLAAGIQTFEEYMMTVVTVLFPELAIPELIVNITQMFATHEFDDLIQQLKDDPVGLISKLASDLKERLFAPENLWKFILLGMQSSPWATLTSLLPKRPRRVTPDPKQTKFGRIVAALRSLGSRFNYTLHRIREYTQPPLRSVQGRIGMHPTLVWLIHRAAHLGEAAFDLIPFDKLQAARKADGPTHLVEFAEVLLSSQESVEEELDARVVELFEGIRRFELPGELIDLQIATEVIIDFLLNRFGPRGKVARMVLEAAPVPAEWAGRGSGIGRAMDVITYEIKKVWSGTSLDPNKYWQDDVLPIVGEKFDEIRDDLVEGLYSVTGRLLEGMGLRPLKPPEKEALPKTEVEADTLLPEGEAAAPRRRPPTAGPAAFPSVGGTALDRTQRARFEPALGADLSHVRLHSAVRAATSALGADAMTSGSHVYLRPGLSPTSREGTRLLAHEMTHVVQQTGPVVPGAPGRRTPTLGRPRLGVRHDPEREAIADRVASGVLNGDGHAPARRGEIGRAAGLQPAMAEQVVEGVLEVLTEHTTPKEFEKSLEGSEPPGWADAKRLADALADRLKSVERVSFAPFLQGEVDGNKVGPEVLNYLGNPFAGAAGTAVLKRITSLGQKPIKKKGEDAPDTEFEPKRFLQLLANHIFADSHVALKITASQDLKDITAVEIFNLDLAGIGGTAKLWDLAMSASFKGNATVTDLPRAQREMRQRLSALRAQPSIWDSREFRFAKWLIDEYVTEVKARTAAKVTDVPGVAEYTKTDSASGQGLAVSTHGQLIKRGIGTFGRESHHTTQYLLIEFFSNHPESTRKAFPEPTKDFEGAGVKFSPTTGQVEQIRGVGGAIEVAALNPNSNRGAEMPAILLSARCHERGELHVLRESRWTDDREQEKERRGTATQGFAIENKFNQAITDPALRPRETSAERRQTLRARIASDPVAASQQYYSAALATYRWMRERMIPALKQGLLTEEMAYYRGIAAQNHSEKDGLQSAYDLKEHHLSHVHGIAAKNNDETMRKYNWKS